MSSKYTPPPPPKQKPRRPVARLFHSPVLDWHYAKPGQKLVHQHTPVRVNVLLCWLKKNAEFHHVYCWWKKSQTTTQHVWNPVNNGISTISYHINWLAGFLPSTVVIKQYEIENFDSTKKLHQNDVNKLWKRKGDGKYSYLLPAMQQVALEDV